MTGCERRSRRIRCVSTAGVVAAAGAAGAWQRRARDGRRRWSSPTGRQVDAALAARVLGDDGPPRLVLLHGMFNSGRYWGGRYDQLSRFGTLVVPDLLGFGRSPRPPTGYSADAHAEAIGDTLEEVGAVGPVVVAAHSVGCVIALRLALRRPDLVASIVAFAPPLYASAEDARARIAGTDPLGRLFLLNEPLSERVCALMCGHRDAAAALVRLVRPGLPPALARDRVEHSWASYSETLSHLVLTAEAPAWLEDIEVPVRLVAGDGDGAVDLSWLSTLADRHPNVTLDVISAGGHDLPLTHPDVCIGALERMLVAAAAIDAARGTEPT